MDYFKRININLKKLFPKSMIPTEEEIVEPIGKFKKADPPVIEVCQKLDGVRIDEW